MKVNWDAIDVLGTDDYNEVVSQAPESKKRYVKIIDYDRLKKDTGIEKFKFEVSEDGHDGYLFDFLPFPVTKKHPKYESLKRLFKGDTPLDWKMNLVLHKVKAPFGETKVLCPEKNFGKPCPFCDKKRQLFDEGGEWNSNPYQHEIKKMNDVERDYFLVRNLKDGKVYVMEYASYFFGQNLQNKLARTKRGETSIVLANPGKNGHSLRFWVDPSTVKDNRGNPIIGKITDMEFEPRTEAVPEDVLESLPSLDEYITQYSYEDMEGMLDGTFFLAGDDEDDDTEEEAPVQRSGRTGRDDGDSGSDRVSRRSRASEPNNSDADADDEPSPSEEPTRSRRQRVREEAAENDEPNVNDVPVEDDREARRRRRREARASQKPACPAGGQFGKDIDTFDECEECALYDACDKENVRLTEENDTLAVI